MHASLQNAAQLTTFTEVDVTEMVRYRDLAREEYKRDDSVKISYNDIIVMTTARALMRHPIMNSTLVGEEILVHGTVHLGIAVALSEGLIVPKLRHAEKKNLLQIAKEVLEPVAGLISCRQRDAGWCRWHDAVHWNKRL